MKRRTAIMTLGYASLGLAANPVLALGAGPDAMERRAARLLAQMRRRAGLRVLKPQTALAAAARTHAQTLQQLGQVRHLDAAQTPPDMRARQHGYPGQVLGELLAETFGTARSTLEAWQEAATSRAVLLDPKARRFGLARQQDADGRIWWSLIMGT